MIQIFDTHAHYDDESFDDDRERLLAGFPAQGVHAVTNIGTNIRASEETVRMTEKYSFNIMNTLLNQDVTLFYPYHPVCRDS